MTFGFIYLLVLLFWPVVLVFVFFYALAQFIAFVVWMIGLTIYYTFVFVRWMCREVLWGVRFARRRLATRVR